MKPLLFYCFSILILSAGCDKGLTPVSDAVISPGFSGTIIYKSKFPPHDSLFDLRVVAVPYYPIDSSFQIILSKVLSGEIAYTPDSLSTAADTIKYTLFVDPKTYYYVAVMQQYGSAIFTDWRVVGIYGYSNTSPTPKPVTVPDGKFIEEINIDVDFYNLPPQPFK